MADLNEWVDEDDDEEEEFLPGADDDDDDAYDPEGEEDEDHGDFPTFLEGELVVDKAKGLCYEKVGAFCLVCQTTLPDSVFNFQSPVLDNPLVFAGWIQDPSEWLEFRLVFSRQPASLDPLELKLLKAQEEKKKASDGKKDDALKDTFDDDKEQYKMASHSQQGSLKAPPSYSLEDDPAQMKKSSAKASLKSPPNSVVVVTASLIKDDREKARRISFRGAYYPPDNPVQSVYIICAVQMDEESATNPGSNGGLPSAVAAASTAAAAPARKRSRSVREDDDSVEGSGGVEYQELIDLHDDAGLSTEELRRRYYGGGSGADNGNEDAKLPAMDKKRMKGQIDSMPTKQDDDDDEDDAYGF
mmetsp:Transcript_1988/g.3567  ORF Transcript_1988/g.3567 Transcript_1988/m.3567 type:complete len:358 (+) Transcript_1988:67-1140(+)